jgi:putative oxidoreductase
MITTVQNLAAPLGRILLSLMFISAGWSKISGYAGTQAFMESAGVPGILLPLVIALELVGGIALLAGWQARIFAFLLAGFTLLSALLFHFDLADQMQSLLFWKNVSIAGGFLMIVALGAGPWSLDNRRRS